MRREAHAAQVGDDDGVILDQPRGERRPHVAGVAEAVEQQDGRPMAADADVDRRADGTVMSLDMEGRPETA